MLQHLYRLKLPARLIIDVLLLVVDIYYVLSLLRSYKLAVLELFDQYVQLFNRFIYILNFFILANLQIGHDFK